MKTLLNKTQILTAGDASLASVTSSVLDMRQLDGACLEVIAGGSPVGTITVQGSADYLPSGFPNGRASAAGTWVTVSLPTMSVSGAGNTLIDITQTAIPFLRVVYTKTSGTGTIDVYATGKAVGA